MVDINEALMRRIKPSPVKRKRVPSSQKKVTASATKSTTVVAGFARCSRPLDDLSQPTTTIKDPPAAATLGSRPESPPPTESQQLYQSPQAAVPTRQAYIDLGQKDFGRHVTCRTCGLLYTAGEEEDEKEHRRFCRDRQRGITVPKWKNERTLKSFPDSDARIMEIRGDDAPLHVKKLLEVKDVLDDALGFVEEDVFLKRGHFLFVQGKQIVGCVTVERIAKAVVLEHDTPSPTITLSTAPVLSGTVPAVLGICRLWVHPLHRKKQIATRLVDIVREKFIYGLHIAKHRVAFSQPTRNGLAFATSYVAPHRVLVYEGNESTSTTTTATILGVKRTHLS